MLLGELRDITLNISDARFTTFAQQLRVLQAAQLHLLMGLPPYFTNASALDSLALTTCWTDAYIPLPLQQGWPGLYVASLHGTAGARSLFNGIAHAFRDVDDTQVNYGKTNDFFKQLPNNRR